MVGPTEGPRDRSRENHQHDIKELLENPNYLEVLRGGIRNAQDLQLAFELLSTLEPEDGGELVKKALELQVRFNYQDSTHFPHEGTLAVTRISGERVSDRSLYEVGEVIFNIGNAEKPELPASGLGALKHELVHAIPFEHLPKKYRETFTAEKCTEPDNVNSIYKSVLSNLIGDEAMAMLSGVSLLESAKRQGIDLGDFPAQKREVTMSEGWKTAAGGTTPTFSMMTEQLRSHSPFYSSSYRFIALRIAFHRCFGDPTEKINFSKLLDDLTTMVNRDGMAVRAFDPKKAKAMFMKDVIPTLQRAPGWISMKGIGMVREVSDVLSKLLSDDNQQVQEFFSKDMDRLVERIAQKIGNERVPLQESALSPSETPIVPARPTPVRAATQTREVTRSEVTANKVEILGKYVELMHELAGTTASEVASNLCSYLNLAEYSDPQSSAQVYSLVIKECLEQGLLSLHGKRDLAFSLLRSGYEDKGGELLASIIEGMSVQGDHTFLYFRKGQIQYLIEHDRQAILERYLDKVIELNAPSMQEFDQWIETNSGYSSEQEAGHERIRQAVLNLINSVTPELEAKLKPNVTQTMREQVDRLAGQLERWQEKKIARYMAEVSGNDPYESIDELTARNPQWGGAESPDDSDRLIGLLGDTSLELNPGELILQCLRSNLTFKQGLTLLERYPVSQQKLQMYRLAAHNLPSCADDQARARLAQGIKDTLRKEKRGYRDWGFSTKEQYSSLNPEDVGIVPQTSFKNTQLYQESILARAELLAGAKAPELRAKAAKVMLVLPTQNKFYEHPANLNTSMEAVIAGYHTFNPAFVRAQAYAELAHNLPARDRIRLSRKALDLLRCKPEINDGYEFVQLDTILKVAETAYKYGDGANFQHAKKTLEYLGQNLPSKPLKKPLLQAWERMNDNYRRVTTFVQLIAALRKGGDELETLVARMELDVQAKRLFFSLEGQIQALRFMQEVKPCPLDQIKDRQLLQRLGDTTVDRYIQSIGSGDGDRFFTDCWPSLVRAIGEMPVDDAMRDRMITRLIERGTPRGMLVTETDRDDSSRYNPSLMYDGFKTLDFVLANPALPRADAALLERLREHISSLNYSRLDDRLPSFINGLDWMYERLADADTVTPEHRTELEKLRQDENYHYLLAQIFAFATPREARPSLQETAAAVCSALDTRDFVKLSALSSAVHKHLADITGETYDQLARGPDKGRFGPRTYILQEDLKDTLFSILFESLNQAYASGDREKSRALLNLLTKGSTVDECMAKLEYYADLLKNEDVPLEDKRQMYRELSRSEYISRYASVLIEALASKGETEKELAAMQISLPSRGAHRHIKQEDTLLALVEDGDLEGVRLFRDTYTEFRRLSWKGLKFDPTNSYGWEIFAQNFGFLTEHTWPRMIGNAAEVMCIMRHGKPAELTQHDSSSSDSYSKEMLRRYGDEVRRALGAKYEADEGGYSFNYSHHLGFVELLTRVPNPREIDPILAKMKDCYDRRERLKDRVAGRQIEMPEIFKDQPTLVQFLASRYMLKLSKGERQDLLLSMEGVPKGAALLRFFEKAHLEKIGQFLSVWPQVPSDIRRELSQLQMSVLPSDREEVSNIIAEKLFDSEVKECLIRHLSAEAVGSGTIGDVFKSRLPDGTEVAVKVITPSKEENFRKGMDTMKRVRDLIEIYGDEIEGGREVIRFVDMYIDMVGRELDLQNELQNYERAKLAYGDTFGMATHYRLYSSSKVLVMQFLPNIKRITDPKVPPEIAKKFMESVKQHFLLSQVLQNGLVLTDLQPGNVVYLDEDPTRPYLLDFGQQTQLSPEDCQKMIMFGTSVALRDSEGMVQFMESVSDRTTHYDQAAAKRFEEQVKEVFADVSFEDGKVTEHLSRILQHASAAGLLVGNKFLQVAKGFATVEGTENETIRYHQSQTNRTEERP